MTSVMPQQAEGFFQRTIPMHTAAQGDSQQQSSYPGPMDGVSSTATNGGQQAMDVAPGPAQDANVAPGGAPPGNQAGQSQVTAKLGQNVFVHKLYNMLEDSSIAHLINWSSTNDSFVITPNAEFAKACSTYFKHTNISSFVRQLNMYGFHKVSDVFHNGSPESPLWEFRHREGAFRRGDFARLSAVKRRASRQALPHRSSFSAVPRVQQQQQPLPGPIPETIQQDPLETRFMNLENGLHDAHQLIARMQETNAALSSRCQMLTDNLTRAYHYHYDMTNAFLTLSDPNQQPHRDIVVMQGDISRQLESMRHVENGHPMEPPNPFHRPSIAQSHLDNNAPPLSPLELAQDDGRRPSFAQRPVFTRPSMPQRSTTETNRRFEPMANGFGRMSPPLRPTLIDPAEGRTNRIPSIAEMAPSEDLLHPNAHLSPPGFPRRHTFADIRPQPQAWPSSEHLNLPQHNNHQQQQQQGVSPYASGQSSSNFPSSPNYPPPNGNPAGEQQRLQDSLARYQMPAPHAPQRNSNTPPGMGSTTLPALNGIMEASNTSYSTSNGHPATNGNQNNSSYSQPQSQPSQSQSSWGPPRLPFKDVFASNEPQTRRSSMAHLLNPADTAERSDEDDVGPDELRKRKRIA